MIGSIKNKKIILSGGAGFIGHHLLNRLATNNTVFMIDNLKRGLLRRFNENENINFHQIDITDLDQMVSLKQEADIFIHLAANHGTENFIKDL